MEGGAGGETVAVVETYALEFTPTWIVAGVCSLIVLISLAAERCLHYIGKVTDPNPHRLPYILLVSKRRFSDDLSLYQCALLGGNSDAKEEEPEGALRGSSQGERRYCTYVSLFSSEKRGHSVSGRFLLQIFIFPLLPLYRC
jgi:hypothetical protein